MGCGVEADGRFVQGRGLGYFCFLAHLSHYHHRVFV